MSQPENETQRTAKEFLEGHRHKLPFERVRDAENQVKLFNVVSILLEKLRTGEVKTAKDLALEVQSMLQPIVLKDQREERIQESVDQMVDVVVQVQQSTNQQESHVIQERMKHLVACSLYPKITYQRQGSTLRDVMVIDGSSGTDLQNGQPLPKKITMTRKLWDGRSYQQEYIPAPQRYGTIPGDSLPEDHW